MKFLIVLIIFAFNSTALADTTLDRTEINKSLQSIKSVPLKYKGQDGIWFSNEDSDKLLQLVEKKLPGALNIIDNQSKQINSLNKAVEGYKTSTAEYEKLAELNIKMFNTAMKHLPSLNKLEPPWYKSSTSTYVYGVMTGIGVIAISAWVLNQSIESK